MGGSWSKRWGKRLQHENTSDEGPERKLIFHLGNEEIEIHLQQWPRPFI